jgi:hypothetical protein
MKVENWRETDVVMAFDYLIWKLYNTKKEVRRLRLSYHKEV